MSNIDSKQRSHTRMDQDNQKNVVTPKASGNDRLQAGHGAPDVEERNHEHMERVRAGSDDEQDSHERDRSGDGNKDIDIEK